MALVVSVVLQGKDKADYHKMANAFAQSLHENSPITKNMLYISNQVPPPGEDHKGRWMYTNTVKLGIWLKVQRENPSQDMVLADADMLCLDRVEKIFEQYEFDVAICNRTDDDPKAPKYNAGIVFLRGDTYNRNAMDFMREWFNINDRMYNDPLMHKPYRRKYCGMNQASLGYLMERKEELVPHVNVIEIPTFMVNSCCEKDWRDTEEALTLKMTPPTFLHLKGSLRKMFLLGKDHPYYPNISETWRHYVRKS
jgi:hypothetical protein